MAYVGTTFGEMRTNRETLAGSRDVERFFAAAGLYLTGAEHHVAALEPAMHRDLQRIFGPPPTRARAADRALTEAQARDILDND